MLVIGRQFMLVESISKLTLATVVKNLTGVLHKEIHSPAAINYFNNSSTCLYIQPRETGRSHLSRHVTVCSHMLFKGTAKALQYFKMIVVFLYLLLLVAVIGSSSWP